MQDCYRRVKKVLKSSSKGGNTVKAINTWTVAAVRYSAGILNWTAEELNAIYRKTRKLMTMSDASHLWTDVDRLYVTWGKKEKAGYQWMMWWEWRDTVCRITWTNVNLDKVLDDFVKKKRNRNDLWIKEDEVRWMAWQATTSAVSVKNW